MKPTLIELKDRAQNPGEVFSRGEVLHVITVAEYYAEQWEKEAWARIDWKERCQLAEDYLKRAVELLYEHASPGQVEAFAKELKAVDLAPKEN